MATKRKSTITDLPLELLHQIFSQLEASDLESVSLVSRLFCSISSALVVKLTFTESPSDEYAFQRLFSRFPIANTVYINCLEVDNTSLVTVLDSDLNLKTLQLGLVSYPSPKTLESISASRNVLNIRSLQLAWFCTDTEKYVSSTLVHKFIKLFRPVTELDFSLSYRWKDKGIERIVLNLPDLRRIKLDGNLNLTDKTLAIMTSNCSNLESVGFKGCYRMTPQAFFSFWSSKPRLKSLDMPQICTPWIDASAILSECIESQVAKNLSHLSLECFNDAVISALAKSRPPMKSLELEYGSIMDYTLESVSELLSVCPGLERLVLHLPKWGDFKKQDVQMSRIVKTLPCLKHIRIHSFHICQATLFSLVQHCRLLETIHLQRDIGDKEMSRNHAIPRPTLKNYSIRSIKIVPDSDKWLRTAIKFYCPNLRK